MFFKNLAVYRLPADWNISAPELEAQLTLRTLQPCGHFDMTSRGWMQVGQTGRLVHCIGKQILITLGVEQKLLPMSIVRQVALDRAVDIAAEQGFPLGRKQMRDLKLKVTEELRARALVSRRSTQAWIDPEHGWFVVDAAGGTRADAVIETLRDTLGSFAVVPVDTDRSPQATMATWLTLGHATSRLTIDDDLELQAADKSKAKIRYTHHPLESKEIRAHLTSGLAVTMLGLTWNARIAFVLTDKFQIKRLQFLEMEQDSDAETSDVDAAEQFDVDFTVMAGELAQLLDDLVDALGGETAQRAAA